MKQFITDAHEIETAGQSVSDRVAELGEQNWSRDKSQSLANIEAINLSDEHWAVIVFLRKYYMQHGLPTHARKIATALSEHFVSQGGNKQGGNKYLHRLFPKGPVSQGSRIAKLRTPAYTTDTSFGTRY